MKVVTAITLALALSATNIALAQSSSMKGMDMGGKDQSAKDATHQTTGTVKSVDAEKGKVTLAHEPVKSLSWPAMTMGFMVKDKKMLKKMAAGEKVQVEFVVQGSDYLITSVK